MLSKAATMMLGLMDHNPLNAYEIVKKLQWMNVKYWYNIADSTVYATIRSLEKKGYISGIVEKDGKMPDKTVYALTENGREELKETLRQSILQVDFDTNVFSIAVFFLDVLAPEEQKELLEKRIEHLVTYQQGIQNQMTEEWKAKVPPFHVADVGRMIGIVNAEIEGTKQILEECR